MHLYIMTRGIKHAVDKFINELSAKYLPIKWKGNDSMVQVSVRPVQLWEIVYPKQHHDVMMNTLWTGGITNNGFAEHQKKWKKFIYPLRKLLGAKKINPKFETTNQMFVDGNGVQKIAIGIKDDKLIGEDEQL